MKMNALSYIVSLLSPLLPEAEAVKSSQLTLWSQIFKS